MEKVESFTTSDKGVVEFWADSGSGQFEIRTGDGSRYNEVLRFNDPSLLSNVLSGLVAVDQHTPDGGVEQVIGSRPEVLYQTLKENPALLDGVARAAGTRERFTYDVVVPFMRAWGRQYSEGRVEA